MSKKPVFKEVTHVSVVVRDLDASVRRYWDEFGIGPWEIHTYDSTNVDEMTVHGQRLDHRMRWATTDLGGILWELVEPLDDNSLYSEFLKEHGEGVHHVGFEVDDYEEALAFFKDKGVKVIQSGLPKPGYGVPYVYYDTRDTLSFISEICDYPEDFELPAPDTTYP